MSNLQMSLKTKWFEMTKARVKKEDYREITPYWVKRLTENDLNLSFEEIEIALIDLALGYSENHIFEVYGVSFKKFKTNTMTLGYPKSGDTERTLNFEHVGIEIREGNPDWGAEPGKIYFVIKHGNLIK